MSQILVISLFVLWVAAAGERLPRGPVDPLKIITFFGGLLVLVAIPAFAARWKSRYAAFRNVWTSIRQVNLLIEVCKFAIAVWFALAVFGSHDWPRFVHQILGRWGDAPFMLGGMILGPLPAVVAFAALWWAQFPIDRLAREQSIMPLLESDLPVHVPPTLRRFLSNNLRMQLLSTAVPLLLIAFLRDAASLVLFWTGWLDPRDSVVAGVASICATAVVLLIAPEPLRHILRTQRLPHSSLRWRLEAISRAARTAYRDVLLWSTGYAVGNAAVMGVLPRIRYVLLSDLLLETMNDKQIEAVFAHELGHVVYRHTLWFVLLIVTLSLLMSGGGALADAWLRGLDLDPWAHTTANVAVGGMWMCAAIGAFGFVSRRFERQADVYAARVMQHVGNGDEPAARPSADARRSPVGVDGAEVIASALLRVATVNNLSISTRSFRHGSIASRVAYLRALARDPHQTFVFDRSMATLFIAMLASLVFSAALVWWLAT